MDSDRNMHRQSSSGLPEDAGKAAANGAPNSAEKTAGPAAEGTGSGTKRRVGSYTTMHPNDPEAASKELLNKLSHYIEQLGGKLAEGWKCDVKLVSVADNGETGTCNASYLTPGGKRLRTRAEVAKFLGLDMAAGKPNKHAGSSTAAAGVHSKVQPAADGSTANAAADADADGEGSGMSKAEAYAAAVARAKTLKEEGITLPLQLKNGVVVEQLGVIDPRPTFCTPLSLITPGYRAVFKDPAVGSFLSEIKAPPGAKHPLFVVSLVPDPQQLAQLADQATTTGRVSLPGITDSQQQAADTPASNSSSDVKVFELASARNADIAWAQVQGLQERARMQVDASAAGGLATANSSGLPPLTPAGSGDPSAAAAAGNHAGLHTDAALDPVLAQLLVKASSLKGCWGKAMFGLADADVLQLIEALPGADATPNYQFVDERGGWEKEREYLAKGRWAKRSALQVGVKKVLSKKQLQQQQSTAAAARAALSAAAPGGSGGALAAASSGGRKRQSPAAAAAAAAAASAGSESVLFGPAASKRYRAMGREDRPVAEAVDKVLDKMIHKLEGWWVNETAREAKKAEKAEARAAAQAAKKAAKAAEAAASGGQDAAEKQQKAAAPSPAPLQEDMQLPGATSSAAPAAAPVFNVLRGKQAHQLLQIWEFACCFGPLLELGEVPSLQQLEAGLLGLVSHTGTMASSMLGVLTGKASAAANDSAQQLESGSIVAAAAVSAGGLDATSMATAAAAAMSPEQVAADTAAGDSWVQLHVATLKLLVDEIFGAVSAATFDTDNMKAAQLKDLRTATPSVDITTWPEAARRYLAAAATATYLAQGEPKSSATGSSAKELDLPGHLRCMEVQDWAQYLCGGLNMPDLISRVALLPQGSSETAAESLMMLDDASALAAAEQLVQQLAKAQPQLQQEMDVDMHNTTSDEQKQQPMQDQQLLGRRLLQALVGVWGEKSKNNSGTRMCFYAQELNPKLGRARGLDLHSVAARLEQGLYQATDDPMQALAADIVLACDLWRDAFNTFDMSREEGFRSADSRLADAVEERLQQLMAEIQAGGDLSAAAGLQQADKASAVLQHSEPAAADTAAPSADTAVADDAAQAGEQHTATADVSSLEAAAAGNNAVAAAADADQSSLQQQQVQSPAVGSSPRPTALPAAQQDNALVQQHQQGHQHSIKQPQSSPVTEQQQQQEADTGGTEPTSPEPQQEFDDTHGLKDPQRPFNPLSGCRVCWREDDNAKLLLCDGCNDEYHCYCVTPALLEVPEGDWYCPVCSKNNKDSSSSGAAAGTTVASSNSSSWDIAAAAQLPLVTDSTSPAWARPGMQYIKELVGTAQQLGEVPYGRWPVAARLELLVLLCELLAASNTGRRFVEERMESKREAKRHMAEARARINKAKKEAADAAKAARAAKKAGAAAGSGAVGDGNGKDAAEESVDAAAAKPPVSAKGSKAAKSKKAAAAAAEAAASKATRAQAPAEEPFDEEAELRTIAMQQQMMELATVRRLYLGEDRFRNTYWLLGTSQLPIVADAADAAAGDDTAAAATASKPPTGLKGHQQQQQRSHSSGNAGMMGTYGVVMVQPADAADGASASAGQSDGATAAANDNNPLRLVTVEPRRSSWLQPAQHMAAGSAAAGVDADAASPWGVYRTLVELDALLAWLNPQGVREAALRTSLLKVRDNMVLFAPPAQSGTAAAGDSEQQQEQGEPRSSRVGSPAPLQTTAAAAAQPAAADGRQQHPKLALKFKLHQQQAQAVGSSEPSPTPAAAGGALGHCAGSTNSQVESLSPEAAMSLHQQLQAAAAAKDDAEASEALRARLQNFMSSIPDISMHEFWGSTQRRDAWYAAVQAASTPAAFAAVVALLDLMLLTDSWRMGWQIWAVPAQHPGLVNTWPQVWHRFLGLEASKRPGLPTRAQRDRAQELAWRAQAAGRGDTGHQQQQRKRQRWEDAGWDTEEQQQQVPDSKRQQVPLYGSRRSASGTAAAQQHHGGSSSRTRGRQQQQEQEQFMYVRSGRAAAAKAAAAITEQSKGLAAPAGRRRSRMSDDEFDDEDYGSEGSSEGEEGQEDRDAALAAALAAEEGHHYPRRAAAVAATVAMASASGHHALLHPGSRRPTRGSNKQQQPSHPQQHQHRRRKAPQQQQQKKPPAGRLKRKKQESESEDEQSVHSELEDPSDGGHSEVEDDMSSSSEHDDDHEGQQAKLAPSGCEADDAAAGTQQQKQQAGTVDACKQQPKQHLKQQHEAAKPQQKRPIADADVPAAAETGAALKQQQPPAKKQKSSADLAEHQQQPQQHAAAAAAAVPSVQQQKHEPATAASTAGTAAPAAAVPAAAAAEHVPSAAAKPKPKIVLKTKLKPQPQSKADALQSLLGGTATLAPLSGKTPTALAAAKAETAAAAAAASRTGAGRAAVPPLHLPGGGSSDKAGQQQHGAQTAAAGKQFDRPLLSPKKMLLERHEKETQQQQQQGQHARHNVSSPRAGAGFRGGIHGFGHGSKARQAEVTNPKLATKQKMALDDEDDD